MHRHQFLRWGSTSLMPISAYPWLAGCSAGSHERTRPSASEQDPDKAAELDLVATLERAHSLGKPVLVFVAPPVTDPQHDVRDGWFGDFLMSADEILWRALVLCELACASMQELHSALPDTEIEGSPLLAVIEHGEKGWSVVSTLESRDLPVVESQSSYDMPDDWTRDQRNRFSSWRLFVCRAVVGDSHGLRSRSDTARARLGPFVGARIDACVSSRTMPDAALISSAPAPLLQAAVERPTSCAHLPRLVVETIRTRVLARGFSGAGWAHRLSCGDSIEESPRPTRHRELPPHEQLVMLACGMGAVPKHCDRFLWFYTDGNR